MVDAMVGCVCPIKQLVVPSASFSTIKPVRRKLLGIQEPACPSLAFEGFALRARRRLRERTRVVRLRQKARASIVSTGIYVQLAKEIPPVFVYPSATQTLVLVQRVAVILELVTAISWLEVPLKRGPFV
jgi:hypothetical protein